MAGILMLKSQFCMTEEQPSLKLRQLSMVYTCQNKAAFVRATSTSSPMLSEQ